MAISNYIVLIGWIFVCIGLFASTTPQRATIIAVLGSFLFLPMAIIEMPYLPSGLNKSTSLAIGIVLGELVSGSKNKKPLKFGSFDLLMLIWCVVVPLATSLSNGLGLFDGVTGIVHRYLTFGVVFWAGRRYFGSPTSLRTLTTAIILGGLIYVPLILVELRLSPILHVMIYGFMQHDFSQQVRYGGYRAMVFTPHGLVVAQWMCVNSIIAFWLWRSGEVKKVWKLGSGVIFFIFAVLTVLCKSAGSLVFMLLGIVAFYISKKGRSYRPLKWLLLAIPVYFLIRMTGYFSVPQIRTFMSTWFDTERINSLMVRITTDIILSTQGMLRPLFGWGWIGRAFPRDPLTGRIIELRMDAFWSITFATTGLLGLFSCYLSMGIGPFLILTDFKEKKKASNSTEVPFNIDAIILCIIISIGLLDSLVNGGPSTVFILCSGAVSSFYQHRNER